MTLRNESRESLTRTTGVYASSLYRTCTLTSHFPILQSTSKNPPITFQIPYLKALNIHEMQLNLFQRRHKIRIAGLVLYFLVIPLFITIFMFVSLSGLFILKLEDGIKSGETNPSTHDHVEFYVTKTCLVHGQSESAARNITCSVQPSGMSDIRILFGSEKITK